MQKINLYIAELMIIFAFIYKNLEKEGIVMKRMICTMLVIVMLLSLCGCGEKSEAEYHTMIVPLSIMR